MKGKGSKKNAVRKIAAASMVIGSLGALNMQNAEASALLTFKALGNGGQVRQNVLNTHESTTSPIIYAAHPDATADKTGEGKCGEGKCGNDKKKEVPTPTATKKAAEGKCGEGKCGK